LSINIEKIETFFPKKKIFVRKLKFPLIRRIISTTGVNTVWKSSEKEDVIYLATKAAQKLITKKDIADIDVVFLVTQTPTYNIPSNSFIIHNKLGLKQSCMVLDMFTP
jgi:3-hydroxy-3-methylglutaryl CoA synthase